MKIIAQTKRGKFYIKEKESGKERSSLVANWQFFRGIIKPEEELNYDDLKKGFLWSQQKGFIEEDSSIISTMIARGQKYGLSPEESVLRAEYFPTSSLLKRASREVRKETSKHHHCDRFFQPLNCSGRTIYPIVDNLEHLKKLFDTGASLIQFRVKNKSQSDIFALVKKAVELAKNYSFSKLIINDHWEAAVESGAFGVHLGQEDIKYADLSTLRQNGLRLGISTHSFWEVSCALHFSPSYIACGPIFQTRVKKMPWSPQGIRNLSYWVRILPKPLVAIGGINLTNLESVKQTGVEIISLINGISAAVSPQEAFLTYKEHWEK
ncbi:thiamine phosphate synthase [Betaproteobacteria bacterium]|nr:thiamine phosphate synthase [Betaproteobacteria bacterium]